MKKTMSLLIVAALSFSIALTGVAYAEVNDFGAAGAENDESWTLEEMLGYAIEDEYMAKAEYDALMSEYGQIRPFSNIVKAEETHIRALVPLFEAYGYELPINDAADRIVLPETLEEIYAIGVEAEIKNIEMYEKFLEEDLPDDVASVFERLMKASENHLKAFEKADSRTGNNGFENNRSSNARAYGRQVK